MSGLVRWHWRSSITNICLYLLLSLWVQNLLSRFAIKSKNMILSQDLSMICTCLHQFWVTVSMQVILCVLVKWLLMSQDCLYSAQCLCFEIIRLAEYPVWSIAMIVWPLDIVLLIILSNSYLLQSLLSTEFVCHGHNGIDFVLRSNDFIMVDWYGRFTRGLVLTEHRFNNRSNIFDTALVRQARTCLPNHAANRLSIDSRATSWVIVSAFYSISEFSWE